MSTIEIDGTQIEMDADGFLANSDHWNKDVARLIAKYDGIEKLSDKHWAIIDIIRQSYLETGITPDIRTMCKMAGIRLREFYELFPLGPARGACRVAGVPKPDGCI